MHLMTCFRDGPNGKWTFLYHNGLVPTPNGGHDIFKQPIIEPKPRLVPLDTLGFFPVY